MSKHLYFFRPGAEARMLARCQFGASENGSAEALLTYPIKGQPWRRNLVKGYPFHLDEGTTSLLFSEPRRIRLEFPESCLGNTALWSDSTEKANGITRDRETDTLCFTIGIMIERGQPEEYFSLRENDIALTSSPLFKTITELIAPYENL